jgi:GxxExxY protein
MDENELSYLIRKGIYSVYNNLGPGLLESVYETALKYELNELGLLAETQVSMPLVYKRIWFETGFRLDIMVERKVIIELKSVERLADVHHKQLLTYLKMSDLKLGILVNFNCSDINNNIIRKVNGLI